MTVIVQDTVTSSGTGFAPEDHGVGSTLCAPGSLGNLTCYLVTVWRTEGEEIADDQLLDRTLDVEIHLMVEKKVPPRDGVAFATVVTVLWYLRRLMRAAIALIEGGFAQGTIVWVAEEHQWARRSKC